jgi:hypothetical protein
MTKYKLKYLYRVIYKDGTHYDQNPDDISVVNNDKSCYSDVKVNDVNYFLLSDGINSWMLDMSDGGFSVNGGPTFYLTTEDLKDVKLLHYRRVVINIEEDNRATTVKYILGYTAKTSQGADVSHSIVIK